MDSVLFFDRGDNDTERFRAVAREARECYLALAHNSSMLFSYEWKNLLQIFKLKQSLLSGLGSTFYAEMQLPSGTDIVKTFKEMSMKNNFAPSQIKC